MSVQPHQPEENTMDEQQRENEEERQRKEMEQAIMACVLTGRSLAILDATNLDIMMERHGMTLALVSKKNQAVTLAALYDGVVELAVRLSSWKDAVTWTRESAAEGAQDEDTRLAFAELIRQTNELFHS